jgi:hypothetical protein
MAWPRKTGSDKLPSHNHPYENGFDRKSADCPHCQANAAKTGVAIHTCEHHGAFGRRDMACARCRELAEGVNAETALGQRLRKNREEEARRSRAIREHNCSSGKCGPVCTAFEW